MSLFTRDEDDRSRALSFKGTHDGLHCQAVRENDPAGDLLGGRRSGPVNRHIDEIRLKALCGRRHGVSQHFISNAAHLERCAFGRADIARKRLARHAAARVREELFRNVKGTDFGLVRKTLARADRATAIHEPPCIHCGKNVFVGHKVSPNAS